MGTKGVEKRGSEEQKRQRRILAELLEVQRPDLLKKAAERASESLLKDALRVSSPAQQERIEDMLEQILLQCRKG